MAESIWSATESAWRDKSLCRTVDPDVFFPDQETEAALTYATETYCNHCPVRITCLNAALINKDIGFFAGTNTRARTALSSKRHRMKCPVCMSVNLITVDLCEVCVKCGASWRTEDRPKDRTPPRVPAEGREIVDVPLENAGGTPCL